MKPALQYKFRKTPRRRAGIEQVSAGAVLKLEDAFPVPETSSGTPGDLASEFRGAAIRKPIWVSRPSLQPRAQGPNQ